MIITEWLENNCIKYDQIESGIIDISGFGVCLVLSNQDIVFDDKMELILNEYESSLAVNIDYFLFEFGDNWYYSEELKLRSLNVLKYIGEFNDNLGIGNDIFLGIHGGYEILNGSKGYGQWVKKAKFLKTRTIGICEKNTLAGVLKFQIACKDNSINPIIGEEVIVRHNDEFYNVKLFVKSDKGWNSLLKINREINVDNLGKFIDIGVLTNNLQGLVIILDPKSITIEQSLAIELIADFKDIYYQIDTVIYDNQDRDKWYLCNLKKFIDSKRYNPVLINDAYYIDREDFKAKQILNSISGVRDFASKNQYFKPLQDNFEILSELFDSQKEEFFVNLFQESVANLEEIEGKCIKFSIQTKVWHFPKYRMTEEEQDSFEDNLRLFEYLIEQGLYNKIDTDIERYRERIKEEKKVIVENNFVDYFLILWDIIHWAKRNDILVGIGRGSAGGSLLAYLIGLTALDPIKYDLLFSRFLNEDRAKVSAPDIDTDFQASRREDVVKYMKERYGNEQVCSIGTYTNLKLKAAFKDISRIEGISFEEANYISQVFDVEEGGWIDVFKTAQEKSRVKEFILNHPGIIEDMRLILNQPRSKSVHACATLILPDEKTLFEWIPVRTEDGEIITEWEGIELETAGFLKEDILGVKQLDKYAFIILLIKEQSGESIDIYNLNLEDPNIYYLFKKGFNGDIFHFGSRGLTNYCKELQPEDMEDLIAGISLYRPGAIENNFHNEYILRRNGDRKVEYFIGSESILDKTYGVFVYQEQIMKLCQVLGGLTLVEADDVRRAMVKKKYEALHQYKDRFLKFYPENFGVTDEYAEEVWDAIDRASTYLFNRCISGKEKIRSSSVPFKYTIGEMYKLKNDRSYAKSRNLIHMYDKLNRNDCNYGYSWSLDNDKLIKNKIKDIRFEGFRDIYRITLVNGSTIDVTNNHKFPTNKGEKITQNLIIGYHKLYYCVGYKQEEYKLGRIKHGEKGLYQELIDIKSIEFIGKEEVYDVEMDSPNHTFVNGNNIVTCNSHATAYAITGYIGQWLKYYHPLQFWTAAFHFDDPDPKKSNISRFISEIRRTDSFIKIKPPHINESSDKFASNSDKMEIYWSIIKVKQLGEKALESIITERNKNGDFFSLEDFLNRVDKRTVNKAVVINLIVSGSFDDIENIKSVQDRKVLINKYYEFTGSKRDKDDEYLKYHEDYWWQIRQKEISGFGVIDYDKVITNHSKLRLSNYEDLIHLQDKEVESEFIVAGIIKRYIIRNTKNGDEYCRVTIDSNDEECEVIIWNDVYSTIGEELFKNSSIIMMNCMVSNNKGANSLQSFMGTDIYFV
jgi:DNA-directed DNA polymerase III PolC